MKIKTTSCLLILSLTAVITACMGSSYLVWSWHDVSGSIGSSGIVTMHNNHVLAFQRAYRDEWVMVINELDSDGNNLQEWEFPDQQLKKGVESNGKVYFSTSNIGSEALAVFDPIAGTLDTLELPLASPNAINNKINSVQALGELLIAFGATVYDTTTPSSNVGTFWIMNSSWTPINIELIGNLTNIYSYKKLSNGDVIAFGILSPEKQINFGLSQFILRFNTEQSTIEILEIPLQNTVLSAEDDGYYSQIEQADGSTIIELTSWAGSIVNTWPVANGSHQVITTIGDDLVVTGAGKLSRITASGEVAWEVITRSESIDDAESDFEIEAARHFYGDHPERIIVALDIERARPAGWSWVGEEYNAIVPMVEHTLESQIRIYDYNGNLVSTIKQSPFVRKTPQESCYNFDCQTVSIKTTAGICMSGPITAFQDNLLLINSLFCAEQLQFKNAISVYNVP